MAQQFAKGIFDLKNFAPSHRKSPKWRNFIQPGHIVSSSCRRCRSRPQRTRRFQIRNHLRPEQPDQGGGQEHVHGQPDVHVRPQHVPRQAGQGQDVAGRREAKVIFIALPS